MHFSKIISSICFAVAALMPVMAQLDPGTIVHGVTGLEERVDA